MMKAKILSAAAVAAMVIGSFGVTAPAMARGDYYGRGDYNQGGYNRGYDRGQYYSGRDTSYNESQRGYYNGNNYNRGRQNYRCRNDGTTGTIVGAIAGGLLGNSVVGRRGDRTAGTLVGGVVGALAGRAIDKGDGRC